MTVRHVLLTKSVASLQESLVSLYRYHTFLILQRKYTAYCNGPPTISNWHRNECLLELLPVPNGRPNTSSPNENITLGSLVQRKRLKNRNTFFSGSLLQETGYFLSPRHFKSYPILSLHRVSQVKILPKIDISYFFAFM